MIAADRTSSCEVVEKLWSIAPATVPAASSDPGPQAIVPDSGASLSVAIAQVRAPTCSRCPGPSVHGAADRLFGSFAL